MGYRAAVPPRRQRGVAVVTALLVTSLAVTLVTGLFWEQQVLVRSMESQRLRVQARLLGLGAIDQAGLALRESAEAQAGLITLDGGWNLPRQFQVDDQDGAPAALSRALVDAQSRFNLRNLAGAGGINAFQLAALARLLATLGLDARLAPAIARAVAPGQGMLGLRDCDDLREVSGLSAEALARLLPFVTVLPEPTAVNVNTAPAEVLTSVANLSLDDAHAMVRSRTQAHFRSTSEFALRLNARETLEGVDYDVSSNYFLITSAVHMARLDLQLHGLLRRDEQRRVALVWLRQQH